MLKTAAAAGAEMFTDRVDTIRPGCDDLLKNAMRNTIYRLNDTGAYDISRRGQGHEDFPALACARAIA